MAVVSIVSLVLTLSKPLMMPLKCTESSRTRPYFASASVNVAALQRITRSVPIAFANVIDPVGAGFVASLARPGGNSTGFSAFEYSLS
jgi:hypothetical protein